MKKIIIAIGIFILFLSFVLKAEEVIVYNYIGNVLIWQDNQWVNIKEKGIVLKEEDKIKTLQKSKVVLLFPNGSTVTVAENTQIVIENLVEKISVYLDEGKLKSKVKGLQTSQIFEVKTAVCVASVRGTEFVLSYIDNQTEILVIEGNVLFNDNFGGSLEVSQNEFCNLTQQGTLGEKFTASEDKINSVLEEFKDVEVEQKGETEKIQKKEEQKIQQKTEKEQFTKEDFAKLKEELRNFVNEARLEKYYVNEIIQQTKDADFQSGRTLRDIHGNLTRVEQVISRNKNNAVEFINITKRDMYKYRGYYKDYAQEIDSDKPRIDILKVGIEFNQDLPQKISEWPKYITEKNKDDSLNFYPTRMYSEITNSYKDSFLQEVIFEKKYKDGKEKLDGKINIEVSNGNKKYQVDTDYDEDIKGELPEGKSKEKDDAKLWTWTYGPMPVKEDINGDGKVNNKDILWLQTEGYIINNNGDILTPSYFTSGKAKDPFTILKEIAFESIIFVRKDDNNSLGSNFYNRNIDLVVTPDIVIALIKQIAPSISDVKIEGDKN
ncbi:MAG: FecR domain-containing protein [Endomicrobiia bacterium]